jgi:cyclophilin family peptidyl-prolyl cis-trans isomerase
MAKPQFDRPPEMQIDPQHGYEATLETSHGSIVADLYPSEAPATVNSFVFLARQGFFDGLSFHRVIRGFVIQGGDPDGNGSGGPGYKFADELDNGLSYEVGTLAMANAGPNTNGSQFFIVTGPQGAALPKNYTIFGKVREGLNAVETIEGVPTGAQDRPRDPVIIERVSIVER